MGSIIKKSTFAYEGDEGSFKVPDIEPNYVNDNVNSGSSSDEIEGNISEESKKILELEKAFDELKQSYDDLVNKYRELNNNYDQQVSSEVTCLLEKKVIAIKDELELETEQSINQLSKISEQIINVFEQEFHLHEDDLKEILFVSFLKILKKEYENDYLLTIIKESIDSAKSSKIVNIIISPKDHKKYIDALTAIVKQRNIQIQPDEKVKLGGCIVRMEERNIDKRLETQIDIFKNILLGADRGC